MPRPPWFFLKIVIIQVWLHFYIFNPFRGKSYIIRHLLHRLPLIEMNLSKDIPLKGSFQLWHSMYGALDNLENLEMFEGKPHPTLTPGWPQQALIIICTCSMVLIWILNITKGCKKWEICVGTRTITTVSETEM